MKSIIFKIKHRKDLNDLFLIKDSNNKPIYKEIVKVLNTNMITIRKSNGQIVTIKFDK